MFKHHNYCPTKEKAVNFSVEYHESTTRDDYKKTYVKGRAKCDSRDSSCGNCALYNMFPQNISE